MSISAAVVVSVLVVALHCILAPAARLLTITGTRELTALLCLQLLHCDLLPALKCKLLACICYPVITAWTLDRNTLYGRSSWLVAEICTESHRIS